MTSKCCYKNFLRDNGTYKISKVLKLHLFLSLFHTPRNKLSDGFPRGKKQNRSLRVLNKIT